MRRFVILACLFLSLPALSAASDPPPFQLIHRQENVTADRYGDNTKSDLMLTVVNLSGGEARDIVVSISVPNPYLFVDSPVFIATIPNGRQAEILHKSVLPNDLIALSEPEERIVWRIEYTKEDGERDAIEISGINGK